MSKLPIRRIAVVGTGSIGGVLAAGLAEEGYEVAAVDRNAAHVDAINQRGLQVEGVLDLTARPEAVLPEQMTGTYDLVLLAVKAMHNRVALEAVRPYLGEQAPVVVFQNGLTGPDVGQLVGEERVIEVSIGWGATYLGPGRIRQTSLGSSILGERAGASRPRTAQVAEVLSVATPVQVSEDIEGHKWSKLLINAALSGTGTLCGFDYGQVLDHPPARRLALTAFTEGVAVADALGVTLRRLNRFNLRHLVSASRVRRAIAEQLLRIGLMRHRSVRASMWQDLQRGHPTEVGQLNGYLVRRGEEAGVATPINRAILEAIRKMEAGRLESHVSNLDSAPLPPLPFF